MPNRIIREGWLESERINQLDASAERFLIRLMLRADDFGRYTANPILLKSNLFPLKEEVRNTDIPRWIAACEKAGLVRCYEVDRKPLIEVQDFRQRTRAEQSKYPAPPTSDGQVPVISQTIDRPPRTYSETYSYSETKSETGKRAAVAAPASDSEWLASLAQNPAYAGVNVAAEHGKMAVWCQVNGKQPTRRRFINWLNRAERPMQSGPALRPPPAKIAEPENWKTFLNHEFPTSRFSAGQPNEAHQWADLDAATQKWLAEKMRRSA